MFNTNSEGQAKIMNNTITGVLWIILSCLFAATMFGIVKKLSLDGFNTFQIIFMRSFFALLLIFPFVKRNHQNPFSTKKINLHLARGIFGFIGVVLYFYAITLTTLPKVVGLAFMYPIISSIFAVIFLKEKPSMGTCFALYIGFIGVFIIIKSGLSDFNFVYLLVFGTAVFWAFADIAIKKMTKTESKATIIFYMSLIMLILAGIFTIPFYKEMVFNNLLWFFLLACVSNLTQFCIVKGFSKTDLSILQPFEFTRLIFVSIIAYFLFGEIVNIWTLVGTIVMIFGVQLIYYYQNNPKTKN